MSDRLLTEVERIAREAGALLLSRFRRPMEVAYKGVANPVTEADTTSERFIKEALSPLVPGASFFGEESGGNLGQGPTWVVDPLDGTTNFAHGFPWFSVSIALVEDRAPVLGVVFHPTMAECYTAVRGGGAFCNGRPITVSPHRDLSSCLLTTGFYYHKGEELTRQIATFERVHQRVQTIRRPGSAALDLAYVAAGYFDGFWEVGLAPWDVAAGFLLVREAGGRVTDFAGNEVTILTPQTLATNGAIHEALKSLIAEEAPRSLEGHVPA